MKKDFEKLQDRLTCININRERISKEFIESYKEDFDIRFSHESTKMEGNTLSIFEVKTPRPRPTKSGNTCLSRTTDKFAIYSTFGSLCNDGFRVNSRHTEKC